MCSLGLGHISPAEYLPNNASSVHCRMPDTSAVMSCHICGDADPKRMKRHYQNIGYSGEKWCGGCHSIFRYHFGGYQTISHAAAASGRMHYVDGMDSRVVTAQSGSNWQGTCSRAEPCTTCASVLSNWNSPSGGPEWKAVVQQQSGFGLSPHVTASSHLPFLSWFSCSSHPGYRGLARPGAAATIV